MISIIQWLSGWKRVVLTAYCLCAICTGKWSKTHPHLTSEGVRPLVGITAAASPSCFPPRTFIEIPQAPGRGSHVWVVMDTGGAMRQGALRGECVIDLFHRSHKAAQKFGRKLGIAREVE